MSPWIRVGKSLVFLIFPPEEGLGGNRWAGPVLLTLTFSLAL